MPFPNKETQFRTGGQQVRIARRGGSVRSPNKRFAAKLREMKKKGVSQAYIKWLVDRIESKEANILHITTWIDELKECMDKSSNAKFSDKIKLLEVAVNFHRINFGDKSKEQEDTKLEERDEIGEMVRKALSSPDIKEEEEISSDASISKESPSIYSS
ncbi:hypothetical protein HYV81_04730 [Candidatus Woesearchaeota archaeon]|nr:hypothetical protein [Candidatus Woesearchaeota archaeon]